MTYDKVIDSQRLENFLTDCANRIRKKAPSPYNNKKYSVEAEDFQNAIDSIPTAGNTNNNCEAHILALPNLRITFRTSTGTIKVWGYAKGAKIGYQQPFYGFEGDSYVRAGLQAGTPTALTLSIDAQGNLTGLPELAEGKLLVTRGI